MERPRLLAGDDAPEPQTAREAKRADSDDAELIFVGVEHRNEDAELIFVGVTSRSKPVVSNILNRVTPGSCLRRKTYGHLRRDAAPKLPPVGRRAAAPAAGTGAPPRGLAGADSAAEPRRESLVVLLSDFYYGQQGGHAPPEHKTHTVFKCLSCAKVLKNVKFMNHVKHHLDLEKQRSDGWESQAACPHCHRPFPSPSQLQRHVESVHAAPGPAAVCRICELAFQTDRALLEHMRASHKPGEMPYVCQACGFRSSVFADVDTHFRASHENTKNLLCPFCLKIFKTASPYMCHYRGHWERSAHQCSRCRLQFLTFKEKMEHKTQRHQTVRQPRQLEGLPPETRTPQLPPRGRLPPARSAPTSSAEFGPLTFASDIAVAARFAPDSP
ncbi:PREDICTED: zinc finger protein 280B [Condylura cristata]|uniref:zinc finger protein 280B n=1 Tax=Condylura cristata TaxID=143302 RepID=UPI0006429AA8|nr:PREDICTED: zinc finger protein 280B [Condylura cristata]